jgi:hypothetical protein
MSSQPPGFNHVRVDGEVPADQVARVRLELGSERTTRPGRFLAMVSMMDTLPGHSP